MIPQIYPADNAPVKDRVQFVKGSRIKVLPEVIKADGGGQFYAIAEKVVKGGVVVEEKLYLQAEDGRLM
jgi:hypothetical protein